MKEQQGMRKKMKKTQERGKRREKRWRISDGRSNDEMEAASKLPPASWRDPNTRQRRRRRSTKEVYTCWGLGDQTETPPPWAQTLQLPFQFVFSDAEEGHLKCFPKLLRILRGYIPRHLTRAVLFGRFVVWVFLPECPYKLSIGLAKSLNLWQLRYSPMQPWKILAVESPSA